MSRLGRSLCAPMPLPWLLPLPLPLTWLLPLPLPRTLPLPEVVITSLPPPLPAEVRTAVALDACVTTTAFVAREAGRTPDPCAACALRQLRARPHAPGACGRLQCRLCTWHNSPSNAITHNGARENGARTCGMHPTVTHKCQVRCRKWPVEGGELRVAARKAVQVTRNAVHSAARRDSDMPSIIASLNWRIRASTSLYLEYIADSRVKG